MPGDLSKQDKKRLKREYLEAHADHAAFGRAQGARTRGSRATAGERAIAWIFCLIYLTVALTVLALVVGFLMVAIWGEAPLGFGVLVPLLVIAGVQFLFPIAAESLSRSRDMRALRRLGKMIVAIHRHA